jgi:hypothetical protein
MVYDKCLGSGFTVYTDLDPKTGSRFLMTKNERIYGGKILTENRDLFETSSYLPLLVVILAFLDPDPDPHYWSL